MAEDAVNTAVKLGNLVSSNGCVTKHLTLMGGDDWDPASSAILSQRYIRMKKSSSGKIVPGAFGTAVTKHLSHSYGSYCHQVAAIAQVCTSTHHFIQENIFGRKYM
jgi:glycerol-3-phosphate dehydrogenase